MRLLHAFSATLASLSLAACGGDDGGSPIDASTPDAELPNPGFVKPDSVTKANENGTEVGDADWTCLNTPSDDVATSVEITLTGVINKIDDPNAEVKDVIVSVFEGTDYMNPLDTTDAPTALDGAFTLTLPAGHTRWGFKVTGAPIMDTWLLNQYFEPATASQSRNIGVATTAIAAALPALVDLDRIPGSGVLAGAVRDCQQREVSHAVATVSATSGTADHLENADSYYVQTAVGLPVRHDALLHTDTVGEFAVFNLPVTATAYIQVWGFVDAADLADGEMTLLAELPSPVVGDTVITGSVDPLRSN